MCDKKPGYPCEACRTINLAKDPKLKPDMQMYDKCSPTKKIDCGRVTELPIKPTCIKVCTKEEYHEMRMGGKKVVKVGPLGYGHGKMMYAIKAGLLVGAVYFTYTQGVWGDQQDVTECMARWSEYVRSLNTRRPPVFDACGKVIRKENPESIIAPLYSMYKEFVTNFFSGVVKLPLVVKCAYFDYLKEMERKAQEDLKERRIRRKG
ncbi:hypothetical protein MSG28_007112 [Choristoneura fumiferana]|uniref:Uncharacterized protein n=1 Tax=Choristoneura fumiferana TaxID=7141 RepID=A0ACC0JMF5_CHOFU|nr:hypothetical protein MSG28_007112 [Choristoneura fumiferana]